MNSDATFQAKILVPKRRPNTLRRPRLLEVAASQGGDVTIVRGPAGFGKTTLLVDLAHETAGAVCWVSLDHWDSDVATFLAHLRLSVKRALGDAELSIRESWVRIPRVLHLSD